MAPAEGDIYGGLAATIVALVCTLVAIFLSSLHIMRHLQNYTEPTFQRYIVRIIFMVPVYATMSFGALVLSQYAMYFNTIRDVYEAWVIYNFLSLCLAWVGGPGAVVTSLSGRLLKPSCLLMTCWWPPIPLDGRFIRRCKQGCLQFVYLKPVLATTCLVLYSRGLYSDGNFSLADSYIYITCVYMASYTVAIYSLILFYVACKDLLSSFHPIPKFLMIKAVVFLTYWQGVLIFMLGEVGLLKGGAEDASDVQNVLICVEMALGALGFMYAFPHTPFMQANIGGPLGATGSGSSLGLGSSGSGAGAHADAAGLTTSIKHAINLHDVVSDTVHQFAPTYHDYVLYSDGSQDAPHHYRTRTFVPLGREMGALRNAKVGRGDGPPLLMSPPSESSDLELGYAMSEPRTASLTSDPSAPRSQPYDPASNSTLHGGATLDGDLGPRPGQGQVGQESSRPGSSDGPGLSGSRETSPVLGGVPGPRLPPPPGDLGRGSSREAEDRISGQQQRSSVSSAATADSSRASSGYLDPSAAERMALSSRIKSLQVGGHHHAMDLLMDESDLEDSDPLRHRDDLEGFIQR